MKRLTKLLAATAAGAALSFAAAASQAAVFISFDGVTTAFTQADGSYDFNAICGAVCGGFETVHISGDTGSAPTLLHSQSVDINTGSTGANGASVTVYVTHKGITGPMPSLGYISSFATNNSTSSSTDLFHTPFSITMSTYADASNGLYGGTLLNSYFNNTPGSSSSNQFAPTLGALSGMYSVTEKYVVTAARNRGDASATSSIILNGFNTAVPEPATWALMIMGFGGAGAMIRSRRRAGVTVA